MNPELSSYLPRAAGKLTRLSFGDWPTPVQHWLRLGQRLGADIWGKRDDLSARIYGGNKIRKLEFLLGEAASRGAQQVLTVGGIGSHHVVATSIYARRVGIHTTAVVVPQPITEHVRRNAELARRCGTTLVPCTHTLTAPIALAEKKLGLERCIVIEPGGSSPIGTLGYVIGALELAQQVQAGELPAPDTIFVPLGSAGTMAGLIIGCAMAGLGCTVVGVRVVERWLANRGRLTELIHRTVHLLRRLGETVPPLGPFEILHDQLGPCYGAPTPAAMRACRLARDTEQIELETTYGGKTMAALMTWCARRTGSRPLLFWHTYNSRPTEELLGPGDSTAPLPNRVRAWLA